MRLNPLKPAFLRALRAIGWVMREDCACPTQRGKRIAEPVLTVTDSFLTRQTSWDNP